MTVTPDPVKAKKGLLEVKARVPGMTKWQRSSRRTREAHTGVQAAGRAVTVVGSHRRTGVRERSSGWGSPRSPRRATDPAPVPRRPRTRAGETTLTSPSGEPDGRPRAASESAPRFHHKHTSQSLGAPWGWGRPPKIREPARSGKMWVHGTGIKPGQRQSGART